jgi:hypothetical protein
MFNAQGDLSAGGNAVHESSILNRSRNDEYCRSPLTKPNLPAGRFLIPSTKTFPAVKKLEHRILRIDY